MPNAFARFQLAGAIGEGDVGPEIDNVITEQLDDVTTEDGDLVTFDG